MKKSQTVFGSIVSILAAAVIGGVLAGCGGSGGANANDAQIRTMTAYVPSAGNNGTLTFTNGVTTFGSPRSYGSFSSGGYMNVQVGTFNPNATGAGAASALQLASPATITAGQRYTLVAAGQEGTNGASAPQLFLTTDFNPNTQLIPAGDVAIRTINLSAGFQNVSLYNTVGGVSTAFDAGTSDTVYGYSGVTNAYVFVPAANINSLSFRGQSDLNTDLTLSGGNLSGFNFTTGHAYTIYLIGQQANGSQPLTVRVVQDWP